MGNLDQAQLLYNVTQVLDETGLPPDSLEPEISESTLMRDDETSIQVVQSLKDRDLRIAADNLDTGYSALRYLKCFSLDILKIDHSLTHDMISYPDSSRIISANHCIGHELGLAGFCGRN